MFSIFVRAKMKISGNLKPASYYEQGKHPNLWRTTNVPTIGCHLQNYYLTPAAAQTVEKYPQILLHYRLYHRDKDKKVCFYPMGEGQPLCAVQTQGSLSKEGPVDNVYILAPEEVPKIKGYREIELASHYPSPFLPFDLGRLIFKAEYLLGRERGAQDYKSGNHSESIYYSSPPFFIYQIFHFLTYYLKDSLHSKILSIRRILEVGSGLGVISFIVSQFLSQAEEVAGVEIDQNSVNRAYSIRKGLSFQGYDVSKTRFYRDDILNLQSPNVKIENYDALIGWFPLAHNFPYDKLIEILKRMKKGGLFFQVLYSDCPFSTKKNNEAKGFRQIKIKADFFPCYIFERI